MTTATHQPFQSLPNSSPPPPPPRPIIRNHSYIQQQLYLLWLWLNSFNPHHKQHNNTHHKKQSLSNKHHPFQKAKHQEHYLPHFHTSLSTLPEAMFNPHHLSLQQIWPRKGTDLSCTTLINQITPKKPVAFHFCDDTISIDIGQYLFWSGMYVMAVMMDGGIFSLWFSPCGIGRMTIIMRNNNSELRTPPMIYNPPEISHVSASFSLGS